MGTFGMQKRGGLAALFFALMLLICSMPAGSVELNDVYRMSGAYRVATGGGIRVYYPERCDAVMPRVISTLRRVKERMTAQFPSLATFEVSVILIDHDDRETSTADPNFDTITLGLTEEIGALSTRGYSFEDRFALRLAHIMILRTLGPAKTAIKRRLGILSMPPWFIEGMALYNAFPMDSLHVSRLYDMARTGRMYSMNDLSLINSRESLVREEMSFQAHAMMNFLHSRSKPDAGYHLLRRIAGNPARFDEMFREAFGMSLKDAFREFSDFVKLECKKRDLPGSTGTSPGEFGEGGFYQGLRMLPESAGWVWVSSAKRREEVYDLWRLGPGKAAAKGNARTVLENVHPSLLVDSETGTTYIGKYIVNGMRQRRLSLWAVPLKGKPFQVVDEPGSFRPLRITAGRLWYLCVENGMTRVRSVSITDGVSATRAVKCSPSRIEFEFMPSLRPLDVAFDVRRGRLLYIQQEGMMRQLMSVDLPDDGAGARVASGTASAPTVLFTNRGLMRYPSMHGDDILFCAETQNRTLQLFRIPAGSSTAVRLTRLPGGVWDYDIMDDGAPLVITLRNGGFCPLIVDLSASLAPLIPEEPAPPPDTACSATPDIALGMFAQGGASATIASDAAGLPDTLYRRKYTPEYRSSYWLPKMNRDDQGAVFGVYSYRSDRLDRNRLEFSPTYGFKSKNWGYTGSYQHRFDLFKVGFAAEDRVVRKSYLSNSYYERIRSQNLSLSYPFSLSTSLTAGMNMTHRGIAEYPEIGDVPTVGRDHSLYAELYHRAIRTEPFWDIFPKRGRVVTASWRRGTNMAGGELMYDSLGIRWNEYVPLGASGWVATLRGWAAEDDKENGIRRPDDLSLGGTDFLRGYEGSVRYGDSLRAAAFHIGREIPFDIPWIQSWVHKELIVAEAFWEMGDVRNTGRRYNYLFDHGVEVRGRVLLLRRIPLTFRTGVGWPHDGGESHSYATVDITTLTGLLQ